MFGDPAGEEVDIATASAVPASAVPGSRCSHVTFVARIRRSVGHSGLFTVPADCGNASSGPGRAGWLWYAVLLYVVSGRNWESTHRLPWWKHRTGCHGWRTRLVPVDTLLVMTPDGHFVVNDGGREGE